MIKLHVLTKSYSTSNSKKDRYPTERSIRISGWHWYSDLVRLFRWPPRSAYRNGDFVGRCRCSVRASVEGALTESWASAIRNTWLPSEWAATAVRDTPASTSTPSTITKSTSSSSSSSSSSRNRSSSSSSSRITSTTSLVFLRGFCGAKIRGTTSARWRATSTWSNKSRLRCRAVLPSWLYLCSVVLLRYSFGIRLFFLHRTHGAAPRKQQPHLARMSSAPCSMMSRCRCHVSHILYFNLPSGVGRLLPPTLDIVFTLSLSRSQFLSTLVSLSLSLTPSLSLFFVKPLVVWYCTARECQYTVNCTISSLRLASFEIKIIRPSPGSRRRRGRLGSVSARRLRIPQQDSSRSGEKYAIYRNDAHWNTSDTEPAA